MNVTLRRLTLLLLGLPALATCTLPPVDVDLSVSLATADQMTLRQSFALRRNSLRDIEPYMSAIRYYPSLLTTFDLSLSQPLGYFVIESEAWVHGYSVMVNSVDPLQLAPGVEFDLSIHSGAAEPYHVVHTLRAAPTEPDEQEEKLVLYRYRPGPGDFTAAALVSGGGLTVNVRSEGLSAEVFNGSAVVAAGAYAAGWSPPEPERLAALTVAGNMQSIEPFGIDDATSAFAKPTGTGTGVEVDLPPIKLEYGRVILAHNTALSYANFPLSNRYRTYLWVSGQPEYSELPIAGRLETVLASGEVLTRTRDRWSVWSAIGEPRGSFPAGKLQFVHERNDIDADRHAVFTLTYWGKVEGEQYLFVKVYSVPSSRLRNID